MVRIRYRATSCFSFRREQATTKMAQTYFCPTPYAAKVALVVSGIRNRVDPYELTKELRKAKVIPHPWGEGVVNTHLVKHWEPPRSDTKSDDLKPDYFTSTVVFREFLYFDGGVDLYIESELFELIKPVISGINTFGKQGSFFVFECIKHDAKMPEPSMTFTGSDFRKNATWEKVSNFEGSNRKPREDCEIGVALTIRGASGDHIHYKFGE